MSASTRIEPPMRKLLSPYNGEEWPVPPDMPDETYAALLERGFKEIPMKQPRKDKSHDE